MLPKSAILMALNLALLQIAVGYGQCNPKTQGRGALILIRRPGEL
jgi:hypothetical protein